MVETSDVRRLEFEVLADFARNREIEHVRVRRLQLVIQAPVNRERSSFYPTWRGNRRRKRCGRRSHPLLAAEKCGGSRKSEKIRQPRPTVYILRTAPHHP